MSMLLTHTTTLEEALQACGDVPLYYTCSEGEFPVYKLDFGRRIIICSDEAPKTNEFVTTIQLSEALNFAGHGYHVYCKHNGRLEELQGTLMFDSTAAILS